MIFKTFDNDLTGLINKIGIFNKSFKTIGRDLSTGHGLLTSLFSGKNVTQKDIQSINAMNQAMKNGSTMAQAWYDNMRGCTVAAKEQAKQCLINKGNLDELSNGLKNVTTDSKLAEIGLTALRTAGNMFLMWGISEVITLFHDLATSTDRLKESAEELGSTLSSTRSDFEDYKKRISELQDVIKSDSSSYQETYDARKQLLGIQDELIEKYGDEAETIRLVTEAINGNNEALDKLSQNRAKEILKDFNEGTGNKWTERFADSLANFFSGSKDNVDRMVNQMEDTKISFRIEPIYDQNLNKLYAEFHKKAKEIFDVQVESTDIGNTFTVSGDLDEIYNKLQNIKSLAQDIGIENSSFFTDLDKQIDKAKDSLDSYGEAYNQYILSTKIFENEDYTTAFNKIREEYKKYQEAFASGDEESIEKAKQSFAEVVHGATEGITDESVVDFFNQMYPDLQAVVAGWEFELRFKAAIDDDKDNFENDVKDYVSNFKTSDDIRNYNEKTATDEQKTAYYELLDLADEYKISLDDLIAKLEQLGLIAPQVDADIRNSIRSISDNHGISDRNEYNQLIAYTADFTEEEKKLWLESTKGAKNATEAIEMYEAALVKAQQTANETGISPLSISQTIDQLNTQLKPAFDSLQSAWQEIFTDDGFALNSIDILSTCDTIKSKLDEMSDPEGLNLDVDYSAFEDFVRVLNNTESTEQDVENAFDSLATSITQAALTGAEDFETMKATLENSGIENSSLVAFDALASNTEMLEQALDEANVSMDDFIVNAKDGSVEATKAGQAFLKEKVGAENYAEALNILAFHKELCNLQEMNTAGEVANLKTLAENAGYTGEVIQYLTELEQIYQEVASGTLTAGQLVAKVGRAAILKGMIDNAASKVQYAPKMDWSGAVKDAGKAGKDSGKSYKDKLKEELSDLESVISGITGRIDDQISSINEQKSAALESIDAQKEALESAKESVVAALEEERQKRLDIIEAQRKQIEQNIKAKQKVVDQINEEIENIRRANDERQRELDLATAKYNLEKMQNMRTKLVK